MVNRENGREGNHSRFFEQLVFQARPGDLNGLAKFHKVSFINEVVRKGGGGWSYCYIRLGHRNLPEKGVRKTPNLHEFIYANP